jgi:cytochrome c-type biogenesis protein CcmF
MLMLGNAMLMLAALASIASIVALIWGTSAGADGEGIVNIGYMATFATLAFVTASSAILLSAFMTNNYQFEYVAMNHSTAVGAWAFVYRFSGMWAGREGSLLFWEWMLALFAGWVAYRRLQITDALSNWGVAITNFVQLFFLVAIIAVVKNNPFQATPAQYFNNGQLDPSLGMNPLLQTWAMVIHPPTLFIGYAGLTIPFAFALAALIVNDPSPKWVKIVDRITVFSWLLLGIGIGLGAIWAYNELAFGGYWAWDPVENASLLPWLTGVGLLHCFTVYRRRNDFKAWSVVMATVTFVLVLLGTFITRSGIVQSVHAFEKDTLSFWLFVVMMIGSLVAGLGLLLWRRKEFHGAGSFEGLVSKDASYYFNNVLMLLAAVLVAYWTLAPSLSAVPLIGRFLPGAGMTFGATSFDAIARPLGILYVFIMAVCPILSWKKTDPATFWERVRWPLSGATVLGAVLLVVWWLQLRPFLMANAGGTYGQVLAVIGLLVASLAVVLPIYLFVDSARKKSKAAGDSFGSSLLGIFTKARNTSGGYITHIGIGVILIGLIGSTMFVQDIPLQFPDKAGSVLKAGAYDVTYKGLAASARPNGDKVLTASFTVSQGGRTVAAINPTQVLPATVLASAQLGGQWKPGDPYPYDSGRREVSILTDPLKDIFATFNGVQAGQGGATMVILDFKINPLIVWVWIGFLLTILGTGLAAWPRRSRLQAA